MPVDNYGIWKGTPVKYTIEDRQIGHKPQQLLLYFADRDPSEPQQNGSPRHKTTPGLCRAAINITSGDLWDSRLVYWVNHRMDQNPLVDELAGLRFGFRPLGSKDAQRLGLDYIRNSLFNTTSGRLLPYAIPGHFNDIIDVLEPNIQQAIDENAEIYLFGSRRDTTNEMHNIHMNQGNGRKFQADDGAFQDGGLLFHFTASGEWFGVFLAFSSQAVHTDDQSGHAISGVGWSDLLRPDIIEDAVVIQEAYVNPPGQGTWRKSVTLLNRTNRPVQLKAWTIRNGAGDVQSLPSDAALKPRIDWSFELPNCALSDRGDTILLLNEHGLKVDGVSYNSQQGGLKDGPIVFAHY